MLKANQITLKVLTLAVVFLYGAYRTPGLVDLSGTQEHSAHAPVAAQIA